MSPRWQSVSCTRMCPCLLPHETLLLLYKWLGSHPQGNVGKTIAGWWGACGWMWKHAGCPQSSWCMQDLLSCFYMNYIPALLVCWILCVGFFFLQSRNPGFAAIETAIRIQPAATLCLSNHRRHLNNFLSFIEPRLLILLLCSYTSTHKGCCKMSQVKIWKERRKRRNPNLPQKPLATENHCYSQQYWAPRTNCYK